MIRRYEGERLLTSLPCYPLNCDPHEEELRKHLLDRGNEFIRLCAPGNSVQKHREYDGLTVGRQQEQVCLGSAITALFKPQQNPTDDSRWTPKL